MPMFAHRQLLTLELPWLDEAVAAQAPRRRPVVPTPAEMHVLLGELSSTTGLVKAWLHADSTFAEEHRHASPHSLSVFLAQGDEAAAAARMVGLRRRRHGRMRSEVAVRRSVVSAAPGRYCSSSLVPHTLGWHVDRKGRR